MSQPETSGFAYPFGEESCEHEVKILKQSYKDFFYGQSPFNVEALSEDTYLIVGRRGSGKTSLAKYFEFQEDLRVSYSINVNEQDINSIILRKAASNPELSFRIPFDYRAKKIARIWEITIWTLIFDKYKEDSVVMAAYHIMGDAERPTHLFKETLKHIATRLIQDDGEIADEAENLVTGKTFEAARQRVLALTAGAPVIVAIDTVERYDPSNDVLMSTLAGLIMCANEFNISYKSQGIHVKVFISGEIFSHLSETVISNTSKFIRDPVHLNWRPRDLTRLICWRFYKYLEMHDGDVYLPKEKIAWNSFDEVKKKMWFPFFGEEIINSRGRGEPSWTYILRHTQMRPRQLVILCNKIAQRASNMNRFPYFKRISLPAVVKETEMGLADEVINSYAHIHAGVAKIVHALKTLPMCFDGNLLDKIAPITASAWPSGNYSPTAFCELVTELGIVGRVRSITDNGIVEADFEYNGYEPLGLNSRDKCVIHPLFYSKLQTTIDRDLIVLPFPDKPEFEEIRSNI